jgi:hypothetical protein
VPGGLAAVEEGRGRRGGGGAEKSVGKGMLEGREMVVAAALFLLLLRFISSRFLLKRKKQQRTCIVLHSIQLNNSLTSNY